MQRTITVEHPGDHTPSLQAVVGRLDAELRKEGVKRDGDFTVVESVNVSGSHSTLTVKFDADARPDK